MIPNTIRPRVGVLTFVDPRLENFPSKERVSRLLERAERSNRRLLGLLDRLDVEVISSPDYLSGKGKVLENVQRLRRELIDTLIVHVTMWTEPNLVVLAAKLLTVPTLILTMEGSLPGFLATSASFDQVGIYNKRLFSQEEEELTREISSFVEAATVLSGLRGKTLGIFGGRSLGVVSATAATSEWISRFGVDVDHVDELEIVKKAEAISSSRAKKFLSWLEESLGYIEYDDEFVTGEKLERMVRCYLATKDLIKKRSFDFVGLKCQTELSDGYVSQCLTPALLNDIEDGEGPHEPIVCACEADMDGALTMEILKLISRGQPTTLMDFQSVDWKKELCVFANCGGMSLWFAARSPQAQVNHKEVHLRANITGKAAGAATQFICKGGPVTLARLCQKNGTYVMYILRGEMVDLPRATLRSYRWSWPYAFIKLAANPKELIGEFGSNHLHAVAGDYCHHLVEYCRLMNLEVRMF